MLPVVSIVCITYNHQRYIADTMEGFLNQNVSFPIEILVGNDASDDETSSVLSRYESLPFVKIYNHASNLGNRGINNLIFLFEKVQGRYAILCEGDDYWTDPNKLQKQVDFLEANQAFGGCFHNLMVFYQDLNYSIPYHPKSFIKRDASDAHNTIFVGDIVKANLGLIAGTSSFLFKYDSKLMEVLEDFTIADRIIQFWIALYKGPLYYMPETMGVYRKHSEGSTASINYVSFETDYDKYYDLIDEHTKLAYFKETRRFRFELYQSCFINAYAKRNKPEARRLLRKIYNVMDARKGDEVLSFILNILRLIKMQL